VRLTVGLITLATVLAAVVAYGTHPGWAQYPHGLGVILFCRQAQWPALFLSVVATLSVVAMVAAGKRRAWWLIGLAPVLALFLHRFATDPTGGMASIEDPAFVPAARASFVNDEDYVVGLTFGDKAYAYPYAGLYSTPVVIHAQHDHRILVIWSPTANRALATTLKRSLRARDLDIVSTPANALLLYDTGRGQFINGLTGLTTRGEKPPAFAAPIPTAKMPWRQWRALHADTVVMVPTGALAARAPRQPLLPSCPMPWKAGQEAAQQPVVVVGTASPVALASSELHGAPVNVTADGGPVVAFRDPSSQLVRAYARKLDDLAPRFKPCRDPARVTKGAVLIDVDTDSGWNADGVAVDAKKQFRNRKLPPVVAEDGLYWGVMKYWYPKLELAAVEQLPIPAAASLKSPTTGPAAKGKPKQLRADRLSHGSAKTRPRTQQTRAD
jgi:hypothetical protein